MQPSPVRPMRIALTIHALFGGGAERLMSQLAARWSSAGHEIHLITCPHPTAINTKYLPKSYDMD